MSPSSPIPSVRPSSTCPRRRRPARPGAALTCLAVAALALTACGSAGSTASPSGSATPGSGTDGPGSGGGSVTTAPVTPGTTAPVTTAPGTVTPSTGTPAATGTTRVIGSRVSYPWGCPSEAFDPGVVKHRRTGSTVPQLVRIAAGHHPDRPGDYGHDRVSFTFTTGFPSYRFLYTDLHADPSGKKVAIKGMGTFKIVFSNARAHTSSTPVRSSIVSRPARPLNLERIVDYAQVGDFEGVLTYGLGLDWAIPHSNPQIPVRVTEVESVTANGGHLYTVAFDLELGNVVRL